MAHTLEEKKRLLNRVRRIMGQVAAIEKALDQLQAHSRLMARYALINPGNRQYEHSPR